MSVHTWDDPNRGFRVHRFFGRITLEDLLATLERAAAAEPEWTGWNALWDFTQAFPTVSPEELERLAESAGHHLGGFRGARAAIVAADDLAFGLARVFGARVNPASDGEVRIFRTREEAVEWVASPGSDRGTDDG